MVLDLHESKSVCQVESCFFGELASEVDRWHTVVIAGTQEFFAEGIQWRMRSTKYG